MNYAYDANHIFRFDLDTPLAILGNRQVDRINIEIQWVEADPEQGEPEGWWVTGHLYGWPLTAKGVRDKRVREREYVSLAQYPKELHRIFWEAWTEALDRSRINTAQIVNPGEGLWNDEKWEVRPDISELACSDCGVKVTYADEGMWPWLGVDGTSTCSTRDNGMPWGHRLDRTLADEVFYQFEQITGQKARHH